MKSEQCIPCRYSAICLGRGRVAVFESLRNVVASHIDYDMDSKVFVKLNPPCDLFLKIKEYIEENYPRVTWDDVDRFVENLPEP